MSLGTQEGIIGSISACGARGVQLLFIINAFLIFHSLEKIELNKQQPAAFDKVLLYMYNTCKIWKYSHMDRLCYFFNELRFLN